MATASPGLPGSARRMLARDDGLHAIDLGEGHVPGRGRPEAGFADEQLLLVVSHQGRGVVDTASGELVARNRDEGGSWFDAVRRAAAGIGPLDGAWIGVCGLAGGRLPDATADGWKAVASGGCVTVSAPGRRPLRVNECEEMRAFGFSPHGATFVIATSPGIAIYRRQDEGQ